MRVEINPDKPPTIFTMGLGHVVTGLVVHDGMPGLYFCPAMKPGAVDGGAKAEVEGRAVPENAVVIRFASMDAVLTHLERVKEMIANFERERAPSGD